jgi:hypothetical protein
MSGTPPNPRIRELAQRLLAYEVAADNPSEADSSAANSSAGMRVFEKLRRFLSTLVGASGFRSLVARALTLAKAQDPRLSAAQINPDGLLVGLSDLGKPDQAAGVILIAQLLGLLFTFIGESLTMSLLLDAWPDLSVFKTLEKSDHDPTR